MKHQHFIVNCSHCITHQCSLLASFSAQTRIGHTSSLSPQHSLQLDNQYFLIPPPQSLQGAPRSVLACHTSSLQLQPLPTVYHHQQPSSFALHSTSVFQPVTDMYMNTVPTMSYVSYVLPYTIMCTQQSIIAYGMCMYWCSDESCTIYIRTYVGRDEAEYGIVTFLLSHSFQTHYNAVVVPLVGQNGCS